MKGIITQPPLHCWSMYSVLRTRMYSLIYVRALNDYQTGVAPLHEKHGRT